MLLNSCMHSYCDPCTLCCRDQGDELQHLKLLYADLQREMEILKTRSESIQTLKTEVHHLGRQILQVKPILSSPDMLGLL